MYRIEFTKVALKEFLAVPEPIRRRIGDGLTAIAKAPRAPNNNVKALRGRPDHFRLRVGDWRAVYCLRDDVMWLLVVRVARRDKVYR